MASSSCSFGLSWRESRLSEWEAEMRSEKGIVPVVLVDDGCVSTERSEPIVVTFMFIIIIDDLVVSNVL